MKFVWTYWHGLNWPSVQNICLSASWLMLSSRLCKLVWSWQLVQWSSQLCQASPTCLSHLRWRAASLLVIYLRMMCHHLRCTTGIDWMSSSPSIEIQDQTWWRMELDDGGCSRTLCQPCSQAMTPHIHCAVLCHTTVQCCWFQDGLSGQCSRDLQMAIGRCLHLGQWISTQRSRCTHHSAQHQTATSRTWTSCHQAKTTTSPLHSLQLFTFHAVVIVHGDSSTIVAPVARVKFFPDTLSANTTKSSIGQ